MTSWTSLTGFGQGAAARSSACGFSTGFSGTMPEGSGAPEASLSQGTETSAKTCGQAGMAAFRGHNDGEAGSEPLGSSGKASASAAWSHDTDASGTSHGPASDRRMPASYRSTQMDETAAALGGQGGKAPSEIPVAEGETALAEDTSVRTGDALASDSRIARVGAAAAWQEEGAGSRQPPEDISADDPATAMAGQEADRAAPDLAPTSSVLDVALKQEVQNAQYRQAEIERGAANDLHIRDVYFMLTGREAYAIETEGRIKSLREEAFLRTEQSDFIGRQTFARNWELNTDRMVFNGHEMLVHADMGARENAHALCADAGPDLTPDCDQPDVPIIQPAARNKEGFAVPGIVRLDRAGETRVVRRVEVHYVSAEHGYMSRETGILDISSDVYVAGTLVVMPGIEATATRR